MSDRSPLATAGRRLLLLAGAVILALAFPLPGDPAGLQACGRRCARRCVEVEWTPVVSIPISHTANYGPADAAAEEKPKAGKERPAAAKVEAGDERGGAGKSVSPTATILRRKGPIGEPWQVVRQNDAVHAGELLLGLPGAVLDSANGAVRLSMRSDLSGVSPFPVVENAVVLHDDKGVDLSFTLDRGRVDVVNRKKAGAAVVRVRVRKDTWDLVLSEPGAAIALELYGRWAAGVPFTAEPGPKDVPTADLVFLVLHGDVSLKHGPHEFLLKPPPGPALIEWDSVTGLDDSPQRLEKLPAWATAAADDTPLARTKKEMLEKFRQQVATRPIGDVLDELLQSDDEQKRRLAVLAMGATDDLKGLGKALREAKHADVWENGILALRHWIGRGPGQDQLLYNAMIASGNFTPVHTETILQLLHGYGEDDLARPETYHMLINYLDHDKLAIRGLAYWHLSRLVPLGRKCGYNPLDDKAARAPAIQNWKKLIPAGQVPARPKASDKK